MVGGSGPCADGGRRPGRGVLVRDQVSRTCLPWRDRSKPPSPEALLTLERVLPALETLPPLERQAKTTKSIGPACPREASQTTKSLNLAYPREALAYPREISINYQVLLVLACPREALPTLESLPSLER
jgi:hypothetical protein